MGERDKPAPRRAGAASITLRNGRNLDLSRAPLIMGILNATPDSFYTDSRLLDPTEAAERAVGMVEDGADIIDIGGESTRPGSEYVQLDVELARVVPLVGAIRARTDVPLSIDTRKAEVARQALDAGADMINDISALRSDPSMGETAVSFGVPIVLMHMQGTPSTMQENPHYEDVLEEVIEELKERAAEAERLGITTDRIIIDPGVGFGKRVRDNLDLIRGIPKIREIGYPVLIGLSRKGFLGALTGGRPIEERLAATIAANAYALLAGADILRVHDVREASDMRRVLRAVAGVE